IPWRAVIGAGHIEEQDEDLAALDMTQELVPQADVPVSAFDEAWYVANREPMEIGVFHDADLRMQRGEGVWGDFGTRVRDGRQQSRLAGIGTADQAHFRDNSQFKEKVTCFAGFAGLREARRLAAGRGEVAVAESASASFAQDKLLT